MTKRSFTLKELSEKLELPFQGNKDQRVSGTNDLKSATSDEVSFFHNEKYASLLQETKAGIVCITKEHAKNTEQSYLICSDPSKTFAEVCRHILVDHSKSGFTDIHPTATIHDTVILGKEVEIGPNVVIDQNVKIGSGTKVLPNSYIGPGSSVGKNCLIHANVVVREDCHIGDRCILQPSCVIGSCGYGYDSCKKTGIHQKIKHLGNVVIEDDVEIGACTTIDRGRFNKTLIKKGTKIDNQCMIAHNCEIGENNLIVSMSGIAGSSKTGRNVVIAAQCGLVGHIEIGDGVILGARSAPTKSIKKPGIYLGAPAQEMKREAMEKIAIRKLPEVMKKLKKAEKFFEAMEQEV